MPAVLAVLGLALAAGCAQAQTEAAGVAVSEEQGLAALTEALRYVEAEVPFKLGGAITVEAYLALREQDPERAKSEGIDASHLVVNAYRAVIPDLRFLAGPPGEAPRVAYATSRILYRYNVLPLTLEEVRPGDLLFFKSPESGEISGVAIVAARAGRVVRVVVASASRGKVVEVGINTEGTYWATQVAGLGRLVLAQQGPSAGQAP